MGAGDHKQLRPKVEQYSLRVESGRGFDLNVSLFERLVKSGYPHTTLELQHRMPPEVRRAIALCVDVVTKESPGNILRFCGTNVPWPRGENHKSCVAGNPMKELLRRKRVDPRPRAVLPVRSHMLIFLPDTSPLASL